MCQKYMLGRKPKFSMTRTLPYKISKANSNAYENIIVDVKESFTNQEAKINESLKV